MLYGVVYLFPITATSPPSLIIICCSTFDSGEWICKACASALGLKPGIEGHEFSSEEVEDNEENQSSEDEDNGTNALVDSDDEEVMVRRKKRRKVLAVDSDSGGE